MDDTEDDARYPPNPSYPHANFRHTPSSSHRPKLPVRNPPSAPPSANFINEDDDYEDDDAEEDKESHDEDAEEEEDEEEENGIKQVSVADEEDDDEEEDDDDDEGDRYPRPDTDDESEGRGRKRRRTEKLVLGYEFAPRVRAPQPPTPAAKPGGGGSSRNSPPEWSEQETFALLNAWGDRFLQLGRKSLRTDEWLEVAKRVSQVSKAVRTDSQCRNRLDTLKKKYKKEKMRLTESSGSTTSKWVYFKKMEMLMSSPPPRQQPGLACGLDSGEYVFMNPSFYINHSNGLDEMRDSPGNSESEEGDDGEDDDDDESEGLPPSRGRIGEPTVEENGGVSSSYRLLADSIHKFGEIYEKIEVGKRQQMMELEKMRIDFHRDLELQKRQILERAQAEIAKIRRGDDEEIDVSAENTSG